MEKILGTLPLLRMSALTQVEERVDTLNAQLTALARSDQVGSCLGH
jgi:hypothetical protein